MSTTLWEIRREQAGNLLEKFGLPWNTKNGTYKRGKCIIKKSKDEVSVKYPSGKTFRIDLNC